jgi:hypothetical protein
MYAGLVPSIQYYRPKATFTMGGNTTNGSAIFDKDVTLAGNTLYQFEGTYYLQRNSSTPHANVGIRFGFGGTSSIRSIEHTGVALRGNNQLTSSHLNTTDTIFYYSPSANLVSNHLPQIFTNNNYDAIVVNQKGFVDLRSSGTFIPLMGTGSNIAVQYSTLVGSYFSITPIGSFNVADANIVYGNWN